MPIVYAVAPLGCCWSLPEGPAASCSSMTLLMGDYVTAASVEAVLFVREKADRDSSRSVAVATTPERCWLCVAVLAVILVDI